MVLEGLWKVPYFRKATYALREESVFEQFLNNLVNDTLWCLDEGVAKLTELKKYEEGPPPSTDEERKNQSQARGHARTVFSISNESMAVIKALSSWAPDVFYF